MENFAKSLILATKFIESVLKSPVVSDIPSARRKPVIGWPVPGVKIPDSQGSCSISSAYGQVLPGSHYSLPL